VGVLDQKKVVGRGSDGKEAVTEKVWEKVPH
jgi:hypothetical protein